MVDSGYTNLQETDYFRTRDRPWQSRRLEEHSRGPAVIGTCPIIAALGNAFPDIDQRPPNPPPAAFRLLFLPLYCVAILMYD